MSKRTILKRLGAPGATRWHDVAPLIKARIVAARRQGDDGEAALWSDAKAFLRRVLHSTCTFPGCGVATAAHRMARAGHFARRCMMHRAMALLLFVLPVEAVTPTVTWNAPVSGVPSGYYLYIWPNGGVIQRIDAGLSTSRALTFPDDGRSYVFWATARNTAGEGPDSNRVTWTAPLKRGKWWKR